MVGVLGFALAASVRADQIVTHEANYTGAKIVTFEHGRLHFRDANGKLRSVWIDQVDLMIVDRGGMFTDFNQAERFLAGGEPKKAVARYRRILRVTEDFWTGLIPVRLLMAADRAGEIDRATVNFIRVVREDRAGPVAAARLIPQAIPAKRDGKVARAISQLDAALSTNPEQPQRVVLALFRCEILRRTGDNRASTEAMKIATTSIPEPLRTERVYTIVLAALEAVLKEDVRQATMQSLDRAISSCPDALLPGFLLVKGRTLLRTAASRADVIRASWPFLRVVAHMPDDPRAADGLYGAALAVERIGQPKKAMELLQECLEYVRLNEETRQKAETALRRLQSPGEASG